MAQPLRDRTQYYTQLQWWLFAGLLLFAVGFYLLIWRPASVRAENLRLQNDRQQQELDAARERAKDLPRIAAENEELTLRIARSKRVPRQSEWAEFVRDLTRLSNQASLKKFSYKYGLAKRIGEFSQLPIDLQFEGDAIDVHAFLRQIEELPRLTRLRSVSLKNRDEKPGHVQVQMSLNTYFSTEP